MTEGLPRLEGVPRSFFSRQERCTSVGKLRERVPGPGHNSMNCRALERELANRSQMSP
jgi:hypothetical protein